MASAPLKKVLVDFESEVPEAGEEQHEWDKEQARFEVASYIAKGTVYNIAAIIFATILLAVLPKSWGLYSPKEFIEVLAPFYSPIITLVLGYFLGKSGSE